MANLHLVENVAAGDI